MIEANPPKAYLTFVTETVSGLKVAEELAAMLQTELGGGWTVTRIEKYVKFEGSFKIEMELACPGSDKATLMLAAISDTDKIASPWLVYFDSTENMLELIFNKSESSRFGRPEFAAVRWGHWQAASLI